jgi:elongation factor Ts
MAADPTNEKKPEDVKEKILQGKIDKFLAEKCLLSQSFIKDPTKTVQQLLQETVAKVGENIRIKRFSRFALAG